MECSQQATEAIQLNGVSWQIKFSVQFGWFFGVNWRFNIEDFHYSVTRTEFNIRTRLLSP